MKKLGPKRSEYGLYLEQPVGDLRAGYPLVSFVFVFLMVYVFVFVFVFPFVMVFAFVFEEILLKEVNMGCIWSNQWGMLDLAASASLGRTLAGRGRQFFPLLEADFPIIVRGRMDKCSGRCEFAVPRLVKDGHAKKSVQNPPKGAYPQYKYWELKQPFGVSFIMLQL